MSNAVHMTPGFIHVAPSDNGFKARMRFHQSWYREHKLSLEPGTNSSASDKNALYGSRLTVADGEAGHNFLSDEIASVAKEHLKDDEGSASEKAQSRLLCDMLSSQPMCFNLFGPLVLDLELATRLVRALRGVPDDLEVIRVALEYAPEPAADYLDDKTSHDAFVEYRRPNGDLGFIGIETKLTEPFTQHVYPFSQRYSRWENEPGWWWVRGAADEHFTVKQYNQLWRNHLLTFSMLNQEPPAYSEAFAAVLYHDDDESCPKAMTKYREHLRAESHATLLDWPLSHVLEEWKKLLETSKHHAWFADFRLRYWDLDGSQMAWDVYQSEHA